jgi:hypothetical protein
MWTVFFYDKTYSKNDLAAYLGVAADTVHAYANGDLRLHVDTAKRVNEFVLSRNPKDRRFAKYFLPEGWTVVPCDIYETLDDIINMAHDLKMKIRASRDNAKREE